MLLSETYIQYVKDITPMSVSDYEFISIDDLALLSRKASLSETSSNGIASHDSGHDSYLDDGTGYSGDDEGSGKCDICSVGMEAVERQNGCHNRKRNRRSRKSRSKRGIKKSKEIKDALVVRELPRTDNFEFEGEKQVEMKWILDCFTGINLVPQLKRVIIDRGRPDDLGVDNLMVFDESSSYCKLQTWRKDVFEKLSIRNQNEAKDHSLFPTSSSCESCTEQRQKEIQKAIDQGRDMRLPMELSMFAYEQGRRFSKAETNKIAPWRKRIMYDLKLNNCRAQAYLRAVRRETILTTSYRLGKSRKRRNGMLERVDEEDWEVYEIISDEEVLNGHGSL